MAISFASFISRLCASRMLVSASIASAAVREDAVDGERRDTRVVLDLPGDALPRSDGGDDGDQREGELLPFPFA